MLRVLGVASFCGVILAAPAAHASPDPAGLWVSLSADCRASSNLREWAGFIAVNVPLDRLAAPHVRSVELGLTEDPQKKKSDNTTPAPAPAPSPDRGKPPLPDHAKPLTPESAAPNTRSEAHEISPAELRALTPALARGAVKHALRAAGYYDVRSRLGSLASRARTSATLPELRLRALRSTGQVLRLTPTTDDPYRYTDAGTSQMLMEARLTWHLDRLVFAPDEVALERLQTERDAAERRLIEQVLDRLRLWQRSRVRAADEDAEPIARETAELEAIGAAVELDVLTDGWFSVAIGEAPETSGEIAKPGVDPAGHAR